MTAWAHQYPLAAVLLINVLMLTVAYTRLYPPVAGSATRLAARTLLVDAAALAMSAALFWGSGVAFVLLGVDLGWFGFALASLIALELPLFAAFVRRYGWPAE